MDFPAIARASNPNKVTKDNGTRIAVLTVVYFVDRLAVNAATPAKIAAPKYPTAIRRNTNSRITGVEYLITLTTVIKEIPANTTAKMVTTIANARDDA